MVSLKLLILLLTVAQLLAHLAFSALGLHSTVATGAAGSSIRVATATTGRLLRAIATTPTTCTSLAPTSIRRTATIRTTGELSGV